MEDAFFGRCSICARPMPLDGDPPHGRCDDCLDVAGVARQPRQPDAWSCVLRVALAVLMLLTGMAAWNVVLVLCSDVRPNLQFNLAMTIPLLVMWMLAGGVALCRMIDDDER